MSQQPVLTSSITPVTCCIPVLLVVLVVSSLFLPLLPLDYTPIVLAATAFIFCCIWGSWMVLLRLTRSSSSSLLVSSLLSTSLTASFSLLPRCTPQHLKAITSLRVPFACTSALMMMSTATASLAYSASQSFTATQAVVEVHIPNEAKQSQYIPIPSSLQLDQLVIIHRHGDRAQIAKTLGQNYPEDAKVAELWQQALPSEESLQRIQSIASHTLLNSLTGTAIGEDPIWSKEVYTGWDQESRPYAQLTDLGVRQLMLVGQHLRQRYSQKYPHIFPTSFIQANQQFYCRSTNICRTIQSLRSLLAGLYSKELSHKLSTSSFSAASEATETCQSSTDIDEAEAVPLIQTRPRSHENMFPQVDGECLAMAHRRAVIFPPSLIHEQITGYERIEKKMRLVLGYPSVEKGHSSKVNWLNVKEILTCHMTHGIQHIAHLDEEDETKATEIAAWTWGVLYKDDILNRFAIGRFIQDLLDDMLVKQKDKTCLIYSGHDSTLVPVLCALGVYDDTWPDYASNLVFEVASEPSKDESSSAKKRFIRFLFNDEIMQLGRYPHTGALYSAAEIPQASTQHVGGWYALTDVIRFLSRLTLTNAQYQVEKVPAIVEEDEEADEEALLQNRNDLSATVSNGGKKSP